MLDRPEKCYKLLLLSSVAAKCAQKSGKKHALAYATSTFLGSTSWLLTTITSMRGRHPLYQDPYCPRASPDKTAHAKSRASKPVIGHLKYCTWTWLAT